jgi:S1-C subfamily serine protease
MLSGILSSVDCEGAIMPIVRRATRIPWLAIATVALAFATVLATPVGARSQDILTLRGPGSRIGATFRNQGQESTKSERGAVVVEVQAKSPAETAGIRSNDIVTEFDGISVRDSRHLSKLIAETPPGRTVSVTVMRDGRTRVFKVTPVLGPSIS